jgi:hypothetical protein
MDVSLKSGSVRLQADEEDIARSTPIDARYQRAALTV